MRWCRAGKQFQPGPFPGAGPPLRQDRPGHREGTPAIEHTDGQDHKHLFEGGGIQGQHQVPVGGAPQAQHPLQQGAKTGAHRPVDPFGAAFIDPFQYHSRKRWRRLGSEACRCSAKPAATRLKPQVWARTMPKLYRARTVSWGLLKWPRCWASSARHWARGWLFGTGVV